MKRQDYVKTKTGIVIGCAYEPRNTYTQSEQDKEAFNVIAWLVYFLVCGVCFGLAVFIAKNLK